MASRKGSVVSAVETIAGPIAEALSLGLWDIEFVKEGATHFLRIYLDKEGGVSIDDCEAFSRAIDKELDRVDPIEQSYCLEVSSPGIERALTKDWHFEKYLGKPVTVRLIRPDGEGRRELSGTLEAFNKETVTIMTASGAAEVKRSGAAYFKYIEPIDDDLLEE
jgi:ribosome maturation factor RimP